MTTIELLRKAFIRTINKSKSPSQTIVDTNMYLKAQALLRMAKKLKEAHYYHEGEMTISRQVWINCPHCRDTMAKNMYGEGIDKDFIIQCRKCNKDFVLGKQRGDARR